MDDYEGWWTPSGKYRSGGGYGNGMAGYPNSGGGGENHECLAVLHLRMHVTIGSDQYFDGNGGSHLPKDYRYKGL